MIRHHYLTPAPPSRVVILGASGFVSRHLKNCLFENYPREKCLMVSSSEADLTKPESAFVLKKIISPSDTVIVCSAVTPDKGRDVRAQMQNIKMGETLVTFLESAGCAHLVYVSSDAVYSDHANPVQETSACDPSSFYGLTHLARERMLADALKKTKTPFLILRPSALYGAEDTHNSYGPNRFIRSAIERKKILLFGGGEEKRDHVYVKDVCRLITTCMGHRSEGILNIATGKSVSFYDLALLISKTMEEPISIETSARLNPITYRHFDITALVKAFPFFSYTPLVKGIEETLEAMVQKK